MKPESKIKVLAELDGFIPPSEKIPLWSHPNFTFGFLENRLPKYLTSYDAIIPLIQKQPQSVKINMAIILGDYPLRTLNVK